MEEFEIISKLGGQKQRKFGETLLVLEKSSNSKLVMKRAFKREVKPIVWDRFKFEKSFSFDFPGLPVLVHHSETEDEIRNVFTYHDGIALDQFWGNLKRKEQLSFLKRFVQKLVPILNHLEKRNVVHCDLKPSNLIIEGTIDSFNVHLIDFGISIRKNDLEQRKILFPLGYAAPELLLNQLEIVDARSDLFSLGIIIWKLYTGELPLRHPNPSIFTNLQLTYPLPNHSSLPKGLFEIVSKMTAKHQFKLPPNKMNQQEVTRLLKAGMELRYNSIKEVNNAIQNLEERKPFYQRISFR